MTVLGRDASDFDMGPVDLAGLGFVTHKVSEGTSIRHAKFRARLEAARSHVPVLGSYHVVRTPGNNGHGSLADQVAYWMASLDDATPWWRTWPHWVHQIDAERWRYDNVSAADVCEFARLLVASGVPGYKVTYASRGQYGDLLTGIATDLWNADYRAAPPNGLYPGDHWNSWGGRPAGWAPYSGQRPRFLQFTSAHYDHDAYAGTLDELLALTGGAITRREDLPMRILQLPSGAQSLIADEGRSVTHIGDMVQSEALCAVWGLTPVQVTQEQLDIALQFVPPAPAVSVTVDAAQVAAALASDATALAAIAKAVNDDDHRRTES